MSDLIGTVITDWLTAQLFTDGRWRVTAVGKVSEAAARNFTSLYGTLGHSPSDGRPGAIALVRAAKDLGGTLTMTPAPPPDDSVVC